ncbi:MAG: nucleotide exchange factor GrpE, partial [Nitrospirae bacterium]
MKKIKKEDFMGNDIDKVTGSEDAENQDAAEAGAEKEDAEAGAAKEKNLEEELQEQKDKHLRLYAEFENYKKRAARDKEELVKYGNESLLYELLPVLDNLDMALKHSSCLSAKQDPS